MGTFHSICVKLLRRHAELVAEKQFYDLDTDDCPAAEAIARGLRCG